MPIFSYVAVVRDTDGSAFITKAEFDSLKNNFQAQIDNYNTSIDSKIDGAIAAYLAGISLSSTQNLKPNWDGVLKPRKVSDKGSRLNAFKREIKVVNYLYGTHGNGEIIISKVTALNPAFTHRTQADGLLWIYLLKWTSDFEEEAKVGDIILIDGNQAQGFEDVVVYWDWVRGSGEPIDGGVYGCAISTVLNGKGFPSNWCLDLESALNFLSGEESSMFNSQGTNFWGLGYSRTIALACDTLSQNVNKREAYLLLEPNVPSSVSLPTKNTTTNGWRLEEKYYIQYAGRKSVSDWEGSAGSCVSAATWDNKWSPVGGKQTYTSRALAGLNGDASDSFFNHAPFKNTSINCQAVLKTGTPTNNDTLYPPPVFPGPTNKRFHLPKLGFRDMTTYNFNNDTTSLVDGYAKKYYNFTPDYRTGATLFKAPSSGNISLTATWSRKSGGTTTSITPVIYIAKGTETKLSQYSNPSVTWDGTSSTVGVGFHTSSQFHVDKDDYICLNWNETLNTTSNDYEFILESVEGNLIIDN